MQRGQDGISPFSNYLNLMTWCQCYTNQLDGAEGLCGVAILGMRQKLVANEAQPIVHPHT